MIKELVNKLLDVAKSHLMIKSTGLGDNFDIQKSDILYPHFFVEYPFSITYLPSTKEVSFSWYIVDLPSESGNDIIDLLNKVELINEDILLKLQLDSYVEFELVDNLNAITLTEWMGDNTIAIRQEIRFRVLRNSNKCEAPFKN